MSENNASFISTTFALVLSTNLLLVEVVEIVEVFSPTQLLTMVGIITTH